MIIIIIMVVYWWFTMVPWYLKQPRTGFVDLFYQHTRRIHVTQPVGLLGLWILKWWLWGLYTPIKQRHAYHHKNGWEKSRSRSCSLHIPLGMKIQKQVGSVPLNPNYCVLFLDASLSAEATQFVPNMTTLAVERKNPNPWHSINSGFVHDKILISWALK